MSPTISVLTPVYNGERYLAECIESVLAQTRADWEFIIVDNCSTDQSVALAERYAAADSRIRVVRCTEFVNAHRNFCRTIEYMDPGSRYCKFICADDWIYPECLEKMVAVAERNPTVGFVSSYRLIGDCLEHDGLLPYTQELMSGREAMRRAIRDGIYVTGSQTQLLYRSEIVRSVKPFFDETTWLADTDAALRTLQRADLGFVHQVLTYTRVHPATITSATTNRLHTYIPFHIGVLIRYGAGVLSPQDYRRLLRSRLRLYWWFLFKQGLKPSRRRDKAFQAFHNTQILRLLSELDRGDRETRLALQSMRMLLAGRITVADLSGEHGKASPEELREHASRMQSQIESAVHSKQS